MGKWHTIVQDEFDGHLVVVEVRRADPEADVGWAGEPAIRITVICLRDCDESLEVTENGQMVTASYDWAGALITFEPVTLDELEGDLIEFGFCTEAAARITSRVSLRPGLGM